MRKQKAGSPNKGNQLPKKSSRSFKENVTTWADPTVPIRKVSKRGKTKVNKNDTKKSCWYFG